MGSSSIATFAQPLHGTSEKDGLPRIAIAIEIRDADDDILWVIDTDGHLQRAVIGSLIPDFTVNLRYDLKTQLWVDPTTASSEPEYGEEE